MSRAMDQRFDRDTAPDVERTDPFRRIDLVSGNRKQVGTQFVHARGDLANRLRCIRVEADAMLVGNFRDVGDRLNRADLVVGVHDADQAGVGCDRLADIIGIDEAGAIDWNITHGHAKLGEMVAWLQRRRVLDLRRDDVRWTLVRRAAYALERKVVRFAAATCENDLVRRAAEQRRDLPSRVFQCGFGRRRCPMATGRISVAGPPAMAA